MILPSKAKRTEHFLFCYHISSMPAIFNCLSLISPSSIFKQQQCQKCSLDSSTHRTAHSDYARYDHHAHLKINASLNPFSIKNPMQRKSQPYHFKPTNPTSHHHRPSPVSSANSTANHPPQQTCYKAAESAPPSSASTIDPLARL